jgi:hypothetical protein
VTKYRNVHAKGFADSNSERERWIGVAFLNAHMNRRRAIAEADCSHLQFSKQLPISNGGYTLVDDFWHWWLFSLK